MSQLGHGPVLVTGGAGFIGSHLVEELIRRDVEVVVVDDLTSGRLSNLLGVGDRVKVLAVDLRTSDGPAGGVSDLLRQQEFKAIFHLAANAYVPPSVENPRYDLATNLMATFNLLEAVRGSDTAPILVNVSSAAVYGDRAERPFREEDPTAPVSPYAVSKLAAEHYVSVFARLYGLRAASVRLFPVYGPRLRKQVIFDLMVKIHENPVELQIHGDGSQVRDFNYVTNVVEALLLVAGNAPLAGEVYNVAGDEPTSIATLVELLCREMGASPRLAYSGSVRPGDSQRWTADITRLRALGYQPRRRMSEGLGETVAWFRSEASSGRPSC